MAAEHDIDPYAPATNWASITHTIAMPSWPPPSPEIFAQLFQVLCGQVHGSIERDRLAWHGTLTVVLDTDHDYTALPKGSRPMRVDADGVLHPVDRGVQLRWQYDPADGADQ